MMKRVAALCLCLCLMMCAGVGSAGTEDDEELHLFLDIPFGSSKEDVIQLVRENGDLKLVEGEKVLGLKSTELIPEPGQKVYVDGEEAKVSFTISAGSGLFMVKITIDKSADFEDLKTCYDKMQKHFFLLYGEPKSGKLVITGEGENEEYKFPRGDKNNIDYETVNHAMLNNKKAMVSTVWGNVQLNMYTSDYGKDKFVVIWFTPHMGKSNGFGEDYPDYRDYLATRDVKISL